MAEDALKLMLAHADTYARKVLAPAVHREAEPLTCEAFRCGEPVTPEEARRGDYERVEPGWRWGPACSTAWFRLTGTIPRRWAGQSVVLRFDSGTEALLFTEKGPQRGFDRNRDAVLLFEKAAGGEPVVYLIEAVCAHPFGTTVFPWDTPETAERWRGATPGELRRCEISCYDHDAWRLWQTWEFLRGLVADMGEVSARRVQLAAALDAARRRIDDTEVASTAAEACSILQEALASGAAGPASRCIGVGHAHIDTAWLWPISETRRKCQRTFANALELIDADRGFIFAAGQPQQYAWIEEVSPALFERIETQVEAGRWEPVGAMWVEPDCNVPSGESLCRQIVHGVRYFESRFGDAAPQRILYLPDTFGFPASLPQIMAEAGLDTFITNKLAWNERNEFPLGTFRWRGIDGTEVLAHATPGHDYNAANTPMELRRGESNHLRKAGLALGPWLQPFGYGDGGGGPTPEMLLRARLAAGEGGGGGDGLPRVELGGMRSFRDELRQAASHAGDAMPVWDGELYLELHRGTYTTQSRLKQANRRAEHALRAAEWLHAAGPYPDAMATGPWASLDDAWKRTLLNQFHDILPGSSIAAVYDNAHADHAAVEAATDAALRDGRVAWAGCVDRGLRRDPYLIFNACSASSSGVVSCDGEMRLIQDVPALGVRVIERSEGTESESVEVNTSMLRNRWLEVTLDATGRIGTLEHRPSGRLVNRMDDAGNPIPLNQLVLYEDRPRAWEAWDIDPSYTDKPAPVTTAPDRVTVLESGPLRGEIEVQRPLGRDSRITQCYRLDAGSPRLDIVTHVTWLDRHRLLRALFPVDVRSRRAVCDIHFGHVERDTHRNTSWQQAMFEVCAHRWLVHEEPGFGVALLNDGKYGHSCLDGVLGLTLLRGPGDPDPGADRGVHCFSYSVMPYAGDWRVAGVDHEAESLNDPLVAIAVPPDAGGAIGTTWSPFTLETDETIGVAVAACKRSEEGDRLILRLVETHGGRGRLAIRWHLAVSEVEAVTLLERPRRLTSLEHEPGSPVTHLTLRPFQIVTLMVR